MSQFVRLLDAATDCIDDMKIVSSQAKKEQVPAVVRLILHTISVDHMPGLPKATLNLVQNLKCEVNTYITYLRPCSYVLEVNATDHVVQTVTTSYEKSAETQKHI